MSRWLIAGTCAAVSTAALLLIAQLRPGEGLSSQAPEDQVSAPTAISPAVPQARLAPPETDASTEGLSPPTFESAPRPLFPTVAEASPVEPVESLFPPIQSSAVTTATGDLAPDPADDLFP